MSSRLALAIEWDHVLETKAKQKTSRKQSPSPSLHHRGLPLTLCMKTWLCICSIFRHSPFSMWPWSDTDQAHITPWKPESYQGSKVFEHWFEATNGKPHIRAYIPSHGGIENYTKWCLSCVCEVQVKRKFLCSVLGSIIPCCTLKYCNNQKEKKFKTHLVSSVSDKGYSVCITGPITSCSVWQLQRTMGSML